MVFITRSKADRILRCTTTTLDTVEELYPKKLFMFTKKEMAHLLRYKILIENPYSYFASYKKVTKKEDTYSYTTERDKPSCHKDRNCEYLNANFSNYIIPEEVQAQGVQKCREFRKWFRANEELLEDEPTKFSELLQEKYGVSELVKVERENSGANLWICLWKN